MDQRNTRQWLAAAAIIVSCAMFGGCGGGQTEQLKSQPPPAAPTHATHAHGPHDGQILELGHEHEFHAELVKETANDTVSIYILDGNLKQRPIEATSLTLVVPIDGTARTFELSAEEADASHFSIADKTLLDGLNSLGSGSGKLRVTIDGNPYTATIELHDH